ncbi:hypothetical protein [Hymenobacter arizonensis]|uniref:hypothetical protein n=1 Tax=Hymenobacter arizonensis TaxID=1227077 RepID=UPI0011607D17|nr:hypothetical protein [Hymenobacter arizonensis]
MAWAVATLFHMAQSRVYTKELHYALLTAAAILLILRPASMLRLTSLITLQLYEVLFRAPYISNHWIFATFVNLTILQALIYLIIKKRSLQIDKGDLIRTFAPVVRIEVIILYFFVVLHKLNWSFLASDASCAAVLYKAQHLDALIPTTDTFLKYNIYFTIIIETLIPVLLIFRKTRNMGVLIGLGFHCVIAFNSLNGFYDFSGMIFAVYVLFTSHSFTNTVANFNDKWTERRIEFRKKLGQFSVKNFVVLLAIFFFSLVALAYLTTQFKDYFRIVWALYSTVFIVLFLVALKKEFWQNTNLSFALPAALFLLVPALVFFNGISPYLGLKTESSFAMFSNLRTEGGITNHVFIPVSTQIFDFQKDMVEVVSSTDKQLKEVASKHQLLPFFQFKNHVAKAKPEQVVYIRNGQQYTFNQATASPDDELRHQSPLILQKLMGFRAISKYEPQPCEH